MSQGDARKSNQSSPSLQRAGQTGAAASDWAMRLGAGALLVGAAVAAWSAFRPLPTAPFEPCEVRAAQVSSTSLVRYRSNDYSVPTTHGHRSVTVKGFVDEVVILAGSEEIARHPRSYERGAFVFDPLHYLALIEQKPGALDQAAPLQGWELPDEFGHLRRLLEARLGNKGKREFIQVLRLMEVLDPNLVALAVARAIKLGALSFDAVKQIAVARLERRPPQRPGERRCGRVEARTDEGDDLVPDLDVGQLAVGDERFDAIPVGDERAEHHVAAAGGHVQGHCSLLSGCASSFGHPAGPNVSQ